MSQSDELGDAQVSFGTRVFDSEGRLLGKIRAFDEHGFYVAAEENIESVSEEHLSTGKSGEASLMWRCWECGEMGQIADVPDECPSCGAPREDIYYWTED